MGCPFLHMRGCVFTLWQPFFLHVSAVARLATNNLGAIWRLFAGRLKKGCSLHKVHPIFASRASTLVVAVLGCDFGRSTFHQVGVVAESTKVLSMALSDSISPGMSAEFEASKVGGIKLRPLQPDDAMLLAQSIYDSFTTFNQSVNIPPHLDFPSVEAAREIMKNLSSAPGTYGVVAEEESSGSAMAAGLITPGDVYGVGPVWADNAFKGKGAGKAVMVALIEKAKSENAKSIRLNQIAANVISFGLYASLGFVPVECWQDIEGCVTDEQSSFASRSVGFHPLTGVHVRKMEDEDVKVCNELNVKANGFGREQEIRMALPAGNAWVLLRDEEIIAYTLGFNLNGHAVAQTEEALVSLFTEVCLQHPASSALPTLHLPGRLYPRLLQWALAAKLRVRRSCWLKVIGDYQSPQHGMVYCPGITA